MLQHTSSEVTVGGKNANKYKRNVKDWYLIRKMKYKQTDFSMKSAKQTKQNLASKEKVFHCQRSHSRQVVIHGSTRSLLFCNVNPNARLLIYQSDPI